MLCVRVMARIPLYVVHDFMRVSAHSRDVGGGREVDMAREEPRNPRSQDLKPNIPKCFGLLLANTTDDMTALHTPTATGFFV
jgi:hypothetical protein